MIRVVRLCCFGSLLAIVVFVLAGCEKSPPIKLGFVGGLTGRVADLGVAGRNGVILAVEEQNDKGGIGGRKVELVVRDDEQKADVAKRVVGELIGEKVVAIVGPMTSSMAVVTVPLVDAARIPMISPTVTTSDLTGKDDHFLRIISTTAEYAAKNARYQYRSLGHRRVAAIYDLGNRAYTESWVNHFRTAFEALGGRVTGVATYQSSEQPQFHELVGGLLKGRPDTILIAANAVDAALICQQVRKYSAEVHLTMAEWAATERLIELGGGAVEGAVVDQYVDRNSATPQYLEFLRRYRERFGFEPGFAGVAGYDAARVAMEGIARATEKMGVREAILATSLFAGLQQQIPIDRYGDASRPTLLAVIRNGQFVTLEQVAE